MRIFIFAIIASGLISVASVFWFSTNINAPLLLDENAFFEIEKGQTPNGFFTYLRSQHNAPISELAGKIWLKLYFSDKSIQTGVYRFSSDMSISQIFSVLNEGRQYQFSITLIEGQTWRQWLQQLRQTRYLIDDWTQQKSTVLLQQSLFPKAAEHNNWEGLLLADTYAYTAYTPISELVLRANKALVDTLNERMSVFSLPEKINSTFELLTLASIVEKETAKPEERPLIAGVFLHRLEKNMKLQTDPTIIYGLGDDFDGDIKRVHIRQATAYNTYVIKGLPPTPIAMIGKEAIDAVFTAHTTDYLYFVSKGDGSHQFSTNLEAHNRAVQKYQLGQ